MLTHPAVEEPNPKRYILVMGGGQDLEQDLLSMYPDISDTKLVYMFACGYMAACPILWDVCFWCTDIMSVTHKYKHIFYNH